MAELLVLLGFALLVSGVALWSIAAALVVAGLCCLVVGVGLAQAGGGKA